MLTPSVRLRLYFCAAIFAGYWALCLFVGAPDNPAAGNLTMEGCFAGWDAVVLQLGYIAICWAFLYFLHKRKIYLKV